MMIIEVYERMDRSFHTIDGRMQNAVIHGAESAA
jgi:hypothetical protein